MHAFFNCRIFKCAHLFYCLGGDLPSSPCFAVVGYVVLTYASSILLHCISHVALHLHMFEFYFILFYCRISEILFQKCGIRSSIVFIFNLLDRFIRIRFLWWYCRLCLVIKVMHSKYYKILIDEKNKIVLYSKLKLLF